MNINEYEPYQKISGLITEYTDKIKSIEAELVSIGLEQQTPPTQNNTASVEEMLAISERNSSANALKLKKHKATLTKALPELEAKKRVIVGDFSYLAASDRQPELSAIKKKMALGFVALQTALLEYEVFERDFCDSGADMRGLDRHFDLAPDAFKPDPYSTPHLNFYRDAIHSELINKKDLHATLVQLFHL